jgi:hypothetical protein
LEDEQLVSALSVPTFDLYADLHYELQEDA